MLRIAAGVWVAAFGLRCLHLWQIVDAPWFDLRLGDADAYHVWARRIADGDWMGQEVFYQAPLYPYFLALIYRLFGDGVVIVRAAQAVVGASSCALIAAAGISLFGRLGALAGLGLACYPPAIFFDGLLEKSSLVVFFTSAFIAVLAFSSERTTRWRCVACGAILGLLALTRENALLLIVPAVAWMVSRPGGFAAPATYKRSPELAGVTQSGSLTVIFRACATIAGCGIVLLPVAARNVVVGGGFHLTTSQFGPNFYIGNHAGASGTYEPLVEGHGSAADERDDATRLAEQALGRSLRPGEVSAYWSERAVRFIRSHPAEWVKLLARKGVMTVNAAEIADTESIEVHAEWSWALRWLAFFDFGVVFAIGSAGVILTAHAWRRVWFLYAIAITYAVSVVIFYVFARYRFPLVPVLLLLGAGGIQQLLSARTAARTENPPAHVKKKMAARNTTRPPTRTPNPAPRTPRKAASLAAAIALALSHLTVADEHASRAVHYTSIGTALSVDPDRVQEAIAFYGRALDAIPDLPGAHFGLATLLTRSGKPELALEHFRAALRSWPKHAELRHNFGAALDMAGRTDEAINEYQEALRIRPDDADTHFALAAALLRLGQADLAIAHYESGLARQPQDVKALLALGVALTEVGRVNHAIARYQRALELQPTNADAHNNLGSTLANSGRIAEAVSHFERAVALNPQNENARRNLEQARRLMKDQ